MAAKKDTKDRSVFVRFDEETGGVLDRIKKILGAGGTQINDAEAIRRLIDEGASRLEINEQLGLHEDLKALQKNPRLGLLNIQTRQRAGEFQTRAELIFLSQFWMSAYRFDGLRRREWVRKEPVAALFNLLHWVARLQKEGGHPEFLDGKTDFFGRWGSGGELIVPASNSGPLREHWVSQALASTIVKMLDEALGSATPFDTKKLSTLVKKEMNQTDLQVALYGYWAQQKVSVLDGPSDDLPSPKFLKSSSVGAFRIDPIQSGNGLTCAVGKSDEWVFSVNSWIEWTELHEVVEQSADGSYEARAGRFTLFSPIPGGDNNQYFLDIVGVRLCFQSSQFHDLTEALRQARGDHVLLALTDRMKDVYGQI